MKKIIIAIDGYSSSGKSTMAKKLAATLGYKYIDSGAMYRAVTLYAMRHGMVNAEGTVDAPALDAALPGIEIDFTADPHTGASHTTLNGRDVEKEIRTMDVAAHVSAVAKIPAVRRFLTGRMQVFGRQKGIVMDGRDIGTTVFPQAEMKVFVDASPQVRAERRFAELESKGTPASYDGVLANILERDHMDTTRAESPLQRAADARVLCNDNMSVAEQDIWLLDLFKEITGSH